MADAKNRSEECASLIARAELVRSNLESQAELCQELAEITGHEGGLAAEWNQVAREMSSLIQTLFPARLGSNAFDGASAKTSAAALPCVALAPSEAERAEETSAVPPSPKAPFAGRIGRFVDLVGQSAKRRAA